MNASGGSKPSRNYGAFRRSLSRQHAGLTESTCKTCRSFVAASVRPELLDFMEKLHFCILQSQFASTAVT
ncbi:MAG TPA: hypothetical protein VN872_04655 [Candidatus Acidoferrum sp.]|nr:hypothetical protein [Candidatus Acidoferrum sp.]